MTPAERARLLVHPNVANVRQYRGGDLDFPRIHAISRWVGDRLEAERKARVAARPPSRECGRFGCSAPAAYVIKTPYDRRVLRCADHARETYEAHSQFANRQGAGTRMEALS